MTRFVEAAMLPYPHKCLSCGGHNDSIDLGITSWDNNYALLVCFPCMDNILEEHAERLNYVKKRKLDNSLIHLELAEIKERNFDDALAEYEKTHADAVLAFRTQLGTDNRPKPVDAVDLFKNGTKAK